MLGCHMIDDKYATLHGAVERFLFETRAGTVIETSNETSLEHDLAECLVVFSCRGQILKDRLHTCAQACTHRFLRRPTDASENESAHWKHTYNTATRTSLKSAVNHYRSLIKPPTYRDILPPARNTTHTTYTWLEQDDGSRQSSPIGAHFVKYRYEHTAQYTQFTQRNTCTHRHTLHTA